MKLRIIFALIIALFCAAFPLFAQRFDGPPDVGKTEIIDKPQYLSKLADSNQPPVTRQEFVLVADRFAIDYFRAFFPEYVFKVSALLPFRDTTLSPSMSNAIARLSDAELLPSFGQQFEGSKPITRFELALFLDLLVKKLSPRFVRKIENKTVAKDQIVAPNQSEAQKAMQRLIEGGFIPVGSPLFIGPSNEVNPYTFAVILSQIAERIASRMRMSDTEDPT
jgi:hypothetical protein